MQRIIGRVLVLLLLILSVRPAAAGWLFGSGDLVTIDGQGYDKEAVRQWWSLWKEPGWAFPADPAPFVRWKILADEGRNMGLDQTPGFAHKIEVFLKVRSMTALKREVVDSRVKVSEEEKREIYNHDYRPIYNMQILYYDTRDKAEAARKELLPFNGRPEGKLVFADAGGLARDKGGPVRFSEVSVAPYKFASQDAIWKNEVDKLKPAGISEVFENNHVFALLRLDSITEPDPADYSKHEKSIGYKIWKREQARLTNELLKSLAEKYGLVIDEEVMAGITLDRDQYDQEFLKKTVARIKDLKIPAAKLVASIKQERKLRSSKKYSPEDFDKLKRIAINSMYSQTMIIWEALDRHYEKNEPLKSQLAFYIESQLNNAVKARLREKARVSDREVEKYYKDHREDFTRPAMMVYSQVTGDKKLLDRANAEIMSGKDFSEVVRQVFHHDAAVSHSRSIDIPPVTRTLLQGLAEGEVSRPFDDNGKFYMVKLVNKQEKKYIPLAQVRGKIRKKLESEKFQASFDDFIKRLQAGHEIKTDSKAWTKFKAELGV